MTLVAIAVYMASQLSVVAAADNLAGWFDATQTDIISAASCASAGSETIQTCAAVPGVQPVNLPAARHRGALECASQCLSDFACDGFAYDEGQKVCNFFVNTFSSVSGNLSSTLWRKQCGLRSTKYANITACASRLLASLPDSAFSATSVHNCKYPQCAKLYNASANCRSYCGAWSAWNNSNDDDFMQIDLPFAMTITGYDIKARVQDYEHAYSQWVTSFRLLYSCDGQTFKPYGYNGTLTAFQGNSDVDSTFSASFVYVIAGARSIRIQPIGFHNGKCLRIELYGC